MPAVIHRDNEVVLSPLENRKISVLGYGSQGRAHALNLHDSGLRVIVAELPDSANHSRAVADCFQPVSVATAVMQCDVIAVMLPDEIVPEVFHREIRDHLTPGKTLVFAHGFNVRYNLIDLPEGVSAVLVAPMGPGGLVREKYLQGDGVPCLIATADSAASDAKSIALAYAKGIGCTRAGAIESTFAEETETDLFAEQAVLCGGINALILAAFETMIEAGYQEEIAYTATVHEIKQTVDLIQKLGPAGMGRAISNTAEYGDLTRGPRIIDEHVKTELRRILDEVRDGRFAREWTDENRAGGEHFEELRRQRQTHSIEPVGRRMREMLY